VADDISHALTADVHVAPHPLNPTQMLPHNCEDVIFISHFSRLHLSYLLKTYYARGGRQLLIFQTETDDPIMRHVSRMQDPMFTVETRTASAELGVMLHDLKQHGHACLTVSNKDSMEQTQAIFIGTWPKALLETLKALEGPSKPAADPRRSPRLHAYDPGNEDDFDSSSSDLHADSTSDDGDDTSDDEGCGIGGGAAATVQLGAFRK
jgi:hypothetical protein